ncbi:transforming acidic coiled-coil-containing protein 1-like isoform X2 [Babylonia areolata]|uniref:transforming acidic coiled-coil-containing protein 1-like isoform X2 n=1 Tax=Babylonia areolata TaxID=304850 RepID=UPI003FD61E60
MGTRTSHPKRRAVPDDSVATGSGCCCCGGGGTGGAGSRRRRANDYGAQGDSGMTSSHSRDSIVKLVQVLKYSQSDWNKLRQELDAHFQAQLRANDGDWSAKLAERDAHVAALEEQIRKLKHTNEDMRVVMGEFEKTIGQLQAEKEKTRNATQQSLQDVLKEKDQALEDLRSVETAFSDLHRRYEKTKAVLEGFKQNEDVLKKCVQDLQNKVKKAEQKTQTVREQAEDRLDRATEELEKVKKTNASEMARLEAALRRAHVQLESMEASLEQKVKENKELTAICDELIAKVQ